MTAGFPTDAAIDRIGRGLCDTSLPKAEWTHAAHFAAALWLLRHRPGGRAEADMPALIRAYNEATGVANSDSGGYHHSITIASLHVAKRTLHRHPADTPLHVAHAELIAGRAGDRDWLLDHWTRDCLFGVAARRGWVPPDLHPLPA